jgi:hypothetical protein
VNDRRFNTVEVASTIEIPLAIWPGKCYQVAAGMLREKIVVGRLAYGHYLGDISPKSTFRKRRGLGWCHHAWIWAADGSVVDPTRWVFEKRRPYVFQGDRYEDGKLIYDEGGTQLAELVHRIKGPGKTMNQSFSTKGLESIAWALAPAMGREVLPKRIDKSWLIWFANLPPHCLIEDAVACEFYAWLKKKRMLAFVPYDFRIMTGFEVREI